jgi:hypothetical protein
LHVRRRLRVVIEKLLWEMCVVTLALGL